MPKFEEVGRENWEEFINSPRAVLMLGKTDCAACNEFTAELQEWLGSGVEGWDDVRIGKMVINKPGLSKFKKQSAWLADVTDLPYTVLYVDGEVKRSFMGGGIDRLTNRMERVFRG